MKIRLAAPLQCDSIGDGEGLRMVLWTQGCIHNCFGCHNPGTHSFTAGYLEDIEKVKAEISKFYHQDGITLSGGDPFCQAAPCLEIARYCQSINLNVWCYTGYTYEELMELSKKNPLIIEFLKNIDVLVDGRFVLAERSYEAKFRGSKNQRVIDVKKSLRQNRVITIKI
jgi:anaerobic ribonucleoside-triphosphate reductase activating protein